MEDNKVTIWKDSDKIRKLFAPTLTQPEFEMFMSLGQGLDANPFTREIWAIKYDSKKPASVFLGRDFYRRKAQEQPDYNGHIVDAVYSNDIFRVKNGEVEHEWNMKDRGKLMGAYCIAYKKHVGKPFYVFLKFEEYNKGFSNWKSMPDTMIRKCAEAAGLRGAWSGLFSGTYDESEAWVDPKRVKIPPAPSVQPSEPDKKPEPKPPRQTASSHQARIDEPEFQRCPELGFEEIPVEECKPKNCEKRADCKAWK